MSAIFRASCCSVLLVAARAAISSAKHTVQFDVSFSHFSLCLLVSIRACSSSHFKLLWLALVVSLAFASRVRLPSLRNQYIIATHNMYVTHIHFDSSLLKASEDSTASLS